MIIVVLTECPPSLRGDLTRWLQEINVGVFVGRLSARVRDQLWQRITENLKDGRATMVYRARNEQRFSFRAHNTRWEPTDFDGVTLMLRPHTEEAEEPEVVYGFSKASKRRVAKQFAGRRSTDFEKLTSYAVIDIETTGLMPEKHRIIEIAALTVCGSEVTGEFCTLVKTPLSIPNHIEKLTGISNNMMQRKGIDISDALIELFQFVGDLPIIMHNADFDTEFLKDACARSSLKWPNNTIIDTLKLSRRKGVNASNYKLETLANYFGIAKESHHRALNDCWITKLVFDKLNEIPSLDR